MKLDWPEITALTLVVLAMLSGSPAWLVGALVACAAVVLLYPAVARKVRARRG